MLTESQLKFVVTMRDQATSTMRQVSSQFQSMGRSTSLAENAAKRYTGVLGGLERSLNGVRSASQRMGQTETPHLFTPEGTEEVQRSQAAVLASTFVIAQMARGLSALMHPSKATHSSVQLVMEMLGRAGQAAVQFGSNIKKMESSTNPILRNIANATTQMHGAWTEFSKTPAMTNLRNFVAPLAEAVGYTSAQKLTGGLAMLERGLFGTNLAFGRLNEGLGHFANDARTRASAALHKLTGGLFGAIPAAESLWQKMRRLMGIFNPLASVIRSAVLALGAFVGAQALVQGITNAFAFERISNQTVVLAGTSARAMEIYRDRILDMSNATGVALNDLASGFYFISSSGYNGAAALDVLAASAQGATIGLGTTREVADLVTSVMNAYGSSAGSAADVVGVLAAAIEQGKGEADEFGRSFGRIMALAEIAQVPFNDLAAAVTTLTTTGLPASEAVSSVRAMLQDLVRPSTVGLGVLRAYGIQLSDINRSLREDGLLSTMQMLRDRMSDYDLGRVVNSVDGMVALLSMTDQNLARSREIADNVRLANAATLDQKFNFVMASDVEVVSRGLRNLSNFFQTLGQNLLPLVASGFRFLAENGQYLIVVLTFLFSKVVKLVALFALHAVISNFGRALLGAAIGAMRLGQWIIRLFPLAIVLVQRLMAAFLRNPIGFALQAIIWAVSYLGSSMLMLMPTLAVFGDTVLRFGSTSVTSGNLIRAVWEVVGERISAVFSGIASWYHRHEQTIIEMFHASEQAAVGFVTAIFNWISDLSHWIMVIIRFIGSIPIVTGAAVDGTLAQFNIMIATMAEQLRALPEWLAAYATGGADAAGQVASRVTDRIAARTREEVAAIEDASRRVSEAQRNILGDTSRPNWLQSLGTDILARAQALDASGTMDEGSGERPARVAPPIPTDPAVRDQPGQSFSERLAKQIAEIRQRTAALVQDVATQALWTAAQAIGLDMSREASFSLEQQNGAAALRNELALEHIGIIDQQVRQAGLETEATIERYRIAGLSQAAQARENALLEARLQWAQDNNLTSLEGVSLTEAQIDAITRLADAQEQLRTHTMTLSQGISAALEDMSQKARDIGGQMRDAITQTLGGAVDNITSMLAGQEADWRDWGFNIISTILRVIVQMLVMKAVMASMKFLGLADGGVVSKSANGNVFANAQRFAAGSAFANSIVSNPTLFRFGKGGSQLGLMGEAGPEAVLPLRRMANGKLGVEAIGGGGGNVFAPVINITVQSSGNAGIDHESAKQIAQVVDATMSKKMQEFEHRQARQRNHLVTR